MNKSYDQRIEEERKVTRRSRQGILLILVYVAFSMVGAGFIGSGMLNEWFMVPFMIILAVGLVLIMGWSIYWLAMSGQQKLERSKEVSERLQPDMPVEEEPIPKTFFLWFIPIALLLLAFTWFLFKAIEDALERFWPDAPFMVSSIGVSIIVSSIIGSILWLTAFYSKKILPQKEESKLVPWKEGLFVMAQLWLPAFLTIFSFGGLPWLIKTYNLSHWIVPLGFLLLGTVLPLLLVSPFPILQWWIWRAVKEGDYEQALSRLRSVEQFKYKDNKLLTLEGRLLFLAGRDEEAQEVFLKK